MTGSVFLFFFKECWIKLVLSSVSLDDISAVQMGRQSEGLKKNTEEQVEDRCFSIIFKSRRKNLDLISSSEEEGKQWVKSLQKVVSNLNNLSRKQKTEQYPFTRQWKLYCEQAEAELKQVAVC